MDDGAAKVPSEIVEAERRLQLFERRTGGWVELVRRIHRVGYIVADEFKSAAVELITSAAGHNVDRRAVVAPIFRREVGGFDGDFLDKINAHVVELGGV